jgi:hypothetical protein
MQELAEHEYILFQLHYHLFSNDRHCISAIIHNECERYILSSIASLEKYIGCEILVDVQAKNEGGIVDNLIISAKKKIPALIISGFIGGWAGSFFRPKDTRTGEIVNKIEILNAIKNNQYTKEEIDYLIRSDKDLQRLTSKYYRKILSVPDIKCISVQAKINNDIFIKPDKTRINRSDFITHLLPEREEIHIEKCNDVQIYIISPVLIKGSKILWKGIYNDLPIDFKVVDNEFLMSVYYKRIKFENGIFINCDLNIVNKIKNDNGRVSTTYEVDHVYSINNDSTFKWIRKPKHKSDAKQQKLFNE